MKVWVVCVSDCETTDVKAICSTKELALRELFKARDALIAEYKHMMTYDWLTNKDDYQRMIDNLSSDDYDKWDNYPHEKPYFYETELIES
jgi:hypothetical protein